MIRYIKGNLFDATTDALAHGCNIQGKMGAGIATEFRIRFPEMFQDYKNKCEEGIFRLGEGYMYLNREKPHIINLATQSSQGAKIQNIDTALAWFAESYEELGIQSVAMPRIGCGLGKLEWEVVDPLVRKYFEKSNLMVEVWTR